MSLISFKLRMRMLDRSKAFDPFDPKLIKATVREPASYISMGLQILCSSRRESTLPRLVYWSFNRGVCLSHQVVNCTEKLMVLTCQ